MSIRIKLVLSYIAMLIIPVVLSIMAAIILIHAYFGSVQNMFWHAEVSQQEEAVLNQITLTISKDPDKLSDVSYLTHLDKELNSPDSGIIIRKNSQILYVSGSMNNAELLRQLPAFGEVRQRSWPIITGSGIFQLKRLDFHFSNNDPGSVYLVTNFGAPASFARKFFPSQFLAVLLILIATNAFLTFIVSRNIIKPIRSLQHAALQIKEGNLDFKVSAKSNDEIGELCRAFEEMRSRLKQSIELQLQYDENRKELISSISHDLKTPVAAIKGYVAGILDGVADTPEKTEKYMRTIDVKVSDIDKLIDELFLFSKLDLNKEPFNFEKVEIKQFLRDSVEELKLDLSKQRIKLSLLLENDAAIYLIADREKLKRVVNNVVDNAVKYMDKEAGKIEVRLTEGNGDFITMQISDNGQGIPKEALSLIFDRFYRLDPSRNTATGGSGLGLAIAKRIIEGLGGKIWAESEPYEGTAIFFTLKKVTD